MGLAAVNVRMAPITSRATLSMPMRAVTAACISGVMDPQLSPTAAQSRAAPATIMPMPTACAPGTAKARMAPITSRAMPVRTRAVFTASCTWAGSAPHCSWAAV